MATENEKGWNRLRREVVREEMKDFMVLLLVCLSFPLLAFCILSKPGRLVGRRALKSEAVFGLRLSSPSLGFSSSGFIPGL